MLFLLPAYLSENTPVEHFGSVIKEYILQTDYFFVENEKQPVKSLNSLLLKKSNLT